MNKTILFSIFLVLFCVSCSQDKCDFCGTWTGQFDNQKKATLIINSEENDKYFNIRLGENEHPVSMRLYSGNDLIYRRINGYNSDKFRYNSDKFRFDSLRLVIENISIDAIFVMLLKEQPQNNKKQLSKYRFEGELLKKSTHKIRPKRGEAVIEYDVPYGDKLISRLILLKDNK